jgi:stage III sporulation protein SpoIIIAA
LSLARPCFASAFCSSAVYTTGGASVLFMGRPGVGKTTAIRELSRLMADDLARRVVIVDTSNEIGGDGDVPHTGIGRARRMQVCFVCGFEFELLCCAVLQ